MKQLIFFITIFPFIVFSQANYDENDVKYKEINTYKRAADKNDWTLFNKEVIVRDTLQNTIKYYNIKFQIFNDSWDTTSIKSITKTESKVTEEIIYPETKYGKRIIKFYDQNRLSKTEYYKWSDSTKIWIDDGVYNNYVDSANNENPAREKVWKGKNSYSVEKRILKNGKPKKIYLTTTSNRKIINNQGQMIEERSINYNTTKYFYDRHGKQKKFVTTDKYKVNKKTTVYKFKDLTKYVNSLTKTHVTFSKHFSKRWICNSIDTIYENKQKNEKVTVYYTRLINGQDKLYLSTKKISKYNKSGDVIEEIVYSASNKWGNTISKINSEKDYKGLFLSAKYEYIY